MQMPKFLPNYSKEDWLNLLEQTHYLIANDLDGKELPDVSAIMQEMRKERDKQLANLTKQFET